MQYRKLGNTGKEISAISFGCMRFPPDNSKAIPLIQRAAELGINYFETSITYCQNRSEVQLGLALKDIRDDVYVSTKSQVRLKGERAYVGVENRDSTGQDFKNNLEESLHKLGMNRVDFYQFHNFRLNKLQVAFAEGGPLEVLKEAKDEGLIDHIGFTSHDTPENIIKIMETGEFESVTLYNNILRSRGNPAKAIKYAHDHSIGVVIMGPLAGGILATPSKQVQALLPKTSSSTVELAFRYLLTNPGITTCISGMTEMNIIEENVRIANEFTPLKEKEMEEIQNILKHYEALSDPICTYCGYCTPCPNNVDIPQIFRLVNFAKVYGLKDWARTRYQRVKALGVGIDNCQDCEECLEKCPNSIPIPERLKEAKQIIEST